MKRDIALLLLAQFLSALADNAILFAAVAMVLQGLARGAWYIPALQAAFLVAFVLLAPWVGRWADRWPKAQVLSFANGIKAAGALALLAGLEPLLAYALVGIGAALYGPAKYGILPELIAPAQLVKVNGWVEGSTILAIIVGALVGASLADRSISLALQAVVVCYFISASLAWMIRTRVRHVVATGNALRLFAGTVTQLLVTPRARFATLGVSLFWGAAAVLRVMLIAWAPLVLGLTQTAEIAELTLYSAIGVALGALLAPRLIPLGYLRRARAAAYCMGIAIAAVSWAQDLAAARGLLLLAGIAGGVFVVPVNAALQDIGHRSVGSGSAVAIQNFFENLAMLATTGGYAWASSAGADPVMALLTLGVLVVLATMLVAWHLPPNTAVQI